LGYNAFFLQGSVTLSHLSHVLIREESIAHKGSPFRLAILDGNETAKVRPLENDSLQERQGS
jgi:hypothetical protein